MSVYTVLIFTSMGFLLLLLLVDVGDLISFMSKGYAKSRKREATIVVIFPLLCVSALFLSSNNMFFLAYACAVSTLVPVIALAHALLAPTKWIERPMSKELAASILNKIPGDSQITLSKRPWGCSVRFANIDLHLIKSINETIPDKYLRYKLTQIVLLGILFGVILGSYFSHMLSYY